MAKHIFLSFVAEDLDRVNLFRGQAQNKKIGLAFDDYSVKVPYNSVNANYIRTQIAEKIRRASVTICLLGPLTSTSSWVDWELRKSYEVGNKVFGVRLDSGHFRPSVPEALTLARAKILDWNIDDIVREIG